MLGALAAFAELLGGMADARDLHRIGVPDQLGESLKKFRSLHREANCVVPPIEWSDERGFKKNWLLWMDCSLGKGVSFEEPELLAKINPYRPLDIFASFYKRKLVELYYTLSSTSIEGLLPILHRAYGEPNHTTRDPAGFLDSVTWADHTASLVVEVVPISPVTADGHFLRIGKGSPTSAVRIRIHFGTIPPSP
jgi:hypothetical protein